MKKEEINTNSLAHTKWNCKYHIVFAPKYRRKVFYVMPPSDEGGGFLRSKKTEGEKTKDYPSVGCHRQLP